MCVCLYVCICIDVLHSYIPYIHISIYSVNEIIDLLIFGTYI